MHIGLFFAAFFAGAVLANGIPHFVKGVCGDSFPTPFAQPPGRGLSPPFVNVLWALVNFAGGLWLLWAAHLPAGGRSGYALLACGFSVMSLLSGLYFPKKQAR